MIMTILTILVLVGSLFMSYIADRNTKYCHLNRHEEVYAAWFLLTAVVLLYHIIP